MTWCPAIASVLLAAASVAADDEHAESGEEIADYEAYAREIARRPPKSVIDTNTVVRLGYELPNSVIVGGAKSAGGNRVYAKGLLAQCAIGDPKRFELADGGALALGSAGFRFDSNYAGGVTNEVVFSGGAIAAFEPSEIRCSAPIRLTGQVRVIARHNLIMRTGFDGNGSIVKSGPAVLALQYPCDNAKGTLSVTAGSLLLGPVASWGGTVRLAKGTTLSCPSLRVIGRLERESGARVIETDGASRTDVSATAFPQPATAYRYRRLRRERLGRGVYAFRAKEDEVFVSWRYRSDDSTNAAFNVYRDGRRVNPRPIADVTYCVDRFAWTGRKDVAYEVRPSGVREDVDPSGSNFFVLSASAPVGYGDIELTPPKPAKTPDGHEYAHFPCDCSVGDLDGDGELELVVIWWPTIAGDNSSWYQTGETWLEGVKLDGTARSLWKICLGPNIRSGSHYVPVMVADFDDDGAAEVICRTADGTVDGTGRILAAGRFAKGNVFKDWRAEDLHVVFAPNYVTCFSGRTGAALDTIPYRPPVADDPKVIADRNTRAVNRHWRSRNPGNQAFRFLAAVGYLDGVQPSVVMCRGYYSRTCLAAYDFREGRLRERWYFSSEDEEHLGYGGQGFHNLRVGDIDFDGHDEIVYGHMCVDHNGQGLWTTGYGHGDAMHLIQASPETRGLQVWTCHEARPFGVSLIDAQTGRTILRQHGPQDTGSCNALDIDPMAPGVELFSGTHCGIFSAKTLCRYLGPKPRPKSNYYCTLRFGIWWMGDMTRSAYSGGDEIWGYSTRGRSVFSQFSGDGGATSNHGSKGAPCLIADILGDWREELLLRRNDNRAIRVYMSAEPTRYRFHTFLEDPVYRWSVATQNCGYNVPADPGFYFGPDLLGHDIWFRGCHLE